MKLFALQSLTIILALTLIAPSQQNDISVLQGDWVVVRCSQNTNCLFQFSYTMNFDVDSNQQLITQKSSLLDGMKNSYDTYTKSYTYSKVTDSNYTLTPSDSNDTIPLHLIIYDDGMAGLYKVYYDSERTYLADYQIWGIQKPSQINQIMLLEALNQTFPNSNIIIASFNQTKLSFPTSSTFTSSTLKGKRWYYNGYWEASNTASSNSRYARIENDDEDQCIQEFYASNFTNGIDGLNSQYNFIDVIGTWNSKAMVSQANFYPFYPDPVHNSWIHQQTWTEGVIYADDNTIIMLNSDKTFARLQTTNPTVGKVIQALFTAKLVASGVNPLNGKFSYYSNSACQAPNFQMNNLVGNWDLTAVAENVNEDPNSYRTLGCIQNNITVDTDAQTVQFAFTGTDLVKQSQFTKTLTFNYTSSTSTQLYPINDPNGDNTPFEIVLISNKNFIIKRENGDKYEAYSFSSTFAWRDQNIDQFILSSIYPGNVIELLYKESDCTPLLKPLQNVTIDVLTNGKWYGLATYGWSYIFKSINCSTWSFTNSTEQPGFFDIEVLAQNNFDVMKFQSTNSPLPHVPGFYVPLLTNQRQNFLNTNLTSMFVNPQYYDGTSMIIVSNNFEDMRSEVHFISKKLEYTVEDEKLFTNIIQKDLIPLDIYAYKVIDNSQCGFNVNDEDQEGDLFLN